MIYDVRHAYDFYVELLKTILFYFGSKLVRQNKNWFFPILLLILRPSTSHLAPAEQRRSDIS